LSGKATRIGQVRKIAAAFLLFILVLTGFGEVIMISGSSAGINVFNVISILLVVMIMVSFFLVGLVWRLTREEGEQLKVTLDSKHERRLAPNEAIDEPLQEFCYCWNCGSRNRSDQSLCWNCGKKLLHE
jgi:Na+/melibiose symporter-like transporter